MSPKQMPRKEAAAKARRLAHQARMAALRDRRRGLSAEERILKQMNDAGAPRHIPIERNPGS